MKDGMLEVGDKLYFEQAFTRGRKSVVVIERLTATQAISGNTRFDRTFRDGSYARGHSGYDAASYYLMTPKAEMEIRYQRQADAIRKVFVNTRLPLTAEQVNRMYRIMHEPTPALPDCTPSTPVSRPDAESDAAIK